MRKLALACLGFCAAIFAAVYALPRTWLLPLAAGAGAALLLSFLLCGNARLRALLLCGGAAFGFLWSSFYTAQVVAPAETLLGETVSLRAEICEVPTSARSVEAILRMEGVPATRVTLLCYDGGLDSFAPGELLCAEAVFSAADEPQSGADAYFAAQGIFLKATLLTAPESAGHSSFAWRFFPQKIAQAIKNEIVRDYPADIAGFMIALLTGDKSQMDDALYAAMSTAGLLHIVAVSGMHVSFIFGVVTALFGRRRRVAFLSLPLLALFVLMAGAGPSVVRAGIMQALLILAPIFRRESDGLTSLAASLSLLLLRNPYACQSVSLQLSFASLFGITLLSPRIYRWFFPEKKAKKKTEKAHALAARLHRAVASGLSGTLGVMVFTVPLSALHFGSVSLIAPVSNLLCLWCLSLCFTAGYGISLLGLVLPVAAKGLSWLLAWPLRGVFAVAKCLASWPLAAAYFSNRALLYWLLFTYLLLLVCLLYRGKKPLRPLLPLCVSLLSFCAVMVFMVLSFRSAGTITVLDVGQGQCICLCTADSTVVIDCGSADGDNAGDIAADYLRGRGRTKIDLLILTHQHSDHANGVTRLLSRMEIARLIMPEDMEPEEDLYDRIVESALESGTDLVTITEDATLTLGDVRLRLHAPLGASSINERGLALRVSLGETDMVVTGDLNAAAEKLLLREGDNWQSEILIVGHHGSRYSTSEEFLEAVQPELAILSVGAYNSYGHPTGETLERLAESGAVIFRTDLQGNITMKMEK